MAKQQYYRCSVAIVEQPNGWYTVSAAEGRYDDEGRSRTTYPNLTWVEVCTLLGALQSEWSDNRSAHHQVLLAQPWEQLTLI